MEKFALQFVVMFSFAIFATMSILQIKEMVEKVQVYDIGALRYLPSEWKKVVLYAFVSVMIIASVSLSLKTLTLEHLNVAFMKNAEMLPTAIVLNKIFALVTLFIALLLGQVLIVQNTATFLRESESKLAFVKMSIESESKLAFVKMSIGAFIAFVVLFDLYSGQTKTFKLISTLLN